MEWLIEQIPGIMFGGACGIVVLVFAWLIMRSLDK